jgi:hypothetical protein
MPAAYAHSPPTFNPVAPLKPLAPTVAIAASTYVGPLVFADTVVNVPQPVQLKNTAVRTSAGTPTSAPDVFVKVIVRVLPTVTKCTDAAKLANAATAEKVTTSIRRTLTPSS